MIGDYYFKVLKSIIQFINFNVFTTHIKSILSKKVLLNGTVIKYYYISRNGVPVYQWPNLNKKFERDRYNIKGPMKKGYLLNNYKTLSWQETKLIGF